MKGLVFISVMIGIWGTALFWISLEPAKRNDMADEQVQIADAEESCGFFTRVQFEVNKLSSELGIAHLVPMVDLLDPEACSEFADVDSDDEDDPRANRIIGGFQKRKVVFSMLDAFMGA